MSNTRDVWRELQQRRRPMRLRGAVALLALPITILALQLRDCLHHGWWPRSTADAALFCLMMTAVVFVVGKFVDDRRRARRDRVARPGVVR